MEIKIESTYKGTRILFAETAKKKRVLINRFYIVTPFLI